MKYIIADSNGDKPDIEAVVDDPAKYVAQFEPIDVVGGRMIAWDEVGNLYRFDGGGNVNESPTKKIAIINVGKWDLLKGEPKLVSSGKNQESQLRLLLSELLTSDIEIRKKVFWRPAKIKKALFTEQEVLSLTLSELIERAEALLESK